MTRKGKGSEVYNSQLMEEAINSLIEQLRTKFFSAEIDQLAQSVYQMPLLHIPGVVMSAICWNIINNQQDLIDKYFENLSPKKEG